MKNTGLIIEKEIKDWIFLSSATKADNEIVVADGDWTRYKPVNEKQHNKYYDTWNCVAYSACNAIEIYFKYLINSHRISTKNILWLNNNGYFVDGEINLSDRFVGVTAGTKIGVGNTGSAVANAIYNHGLIPESMLTFTDDVAEDDYYNPVDSKLTKLGEQFKERFKIQFESFWVKDIETALKYAPTQVYVYAWKKNNAGLYDNPDKKMNHAVVRLRSQTKQIFDTYEPFIKSLTTNYYYWPFGYKYSVLEIVDHMNVEEFINNNDLLFVRNTKTGQFGRIMQGKLKVVETSDRGTLLLLDEAVRTNGRGLSESEWDMLPKEKF